MEVYLWTVICMVHVFIFFSSGGREKTSINFLGLTNHHCARVINLFSFETPAFKISDDLNFRSPSRLFSKVAKLMLIKQTSPESFLFEAFKLKYPLCKMTNFDLNLDQWNFDLFRHQPLQLTPYSICCSSSRFINNQLFWVKSAYPNTLPVISSSRLLKCESETILPSSFTRLKLQDSTKRELNSLQTRLESLRHISKLWWWQVGGIFFRECCGRILSNETAMKGKKKEKSAHLKNSSMKRSKSASANW